MALVDGTASPRKWSKMASSKDRASERRERRAREIQERRANRRDVGQKQVRNRKATRYGLMAAGVVLALGLIYGGYTIYDDWESRRPPEGVQEFAGLSAVHTNEPVQYAQS